MSAAGRLPPIAAFHILTPDSSSGRHCPGIGRLQSHAKPIPKQQQYPGALQPKEDIDFVSYSVFPFRLLVADYSRPVDEVALYRCSVKRFGNNAS